MNVDAEIFGDVKICSAVFCDCAEEWQVGDVLHGGEKQGRSIGGDHADVSWVVALVRLAGRVTVVEVVVLFPTFMPRWLKRCWLMSMIR